MSNKRVALVTGAGRGIGRSIALALAARGWAVVVNYRSNAAAAEETLRAIWAAGGGGLVIQADIASAADRERLVTETLAHYSRVDLLVNNAGMAPRVRADILEVSEASYDEVMAVNLKGPFFLTQRVAQAMIAQRAANPDSAPLIVNIGSINAYTASVKRPEYCLSKAGIAMMTALYADRLAQHNIPVYEVRPGIIATEMIEPVRAFYDKLIAEGLTPMRRFGQPEDVARAVVTLAEGGLSFATGAVIDVDGGFHLRRL
ncbi:MAG: 3-ketoacyl-ACP reductase [Aggregatilineales bacterium]